LLRNTFVDVSIAVVVQLVAGFSKRVRIGPIAIRRTDRHRRLLVTFHDSYTALANSLARLADGEVHVSLLLINEPVAIVVEPITQFGGDVIPGRADGCCTILATDHDSAVAGPNAALTVQLLLGAVEVSYLEFLVHYSIAIIVQAIAKSIAFARIVRYRRGIADPCSGIANDFEGPPTSSAHTLGGATTQVWREETIVDDAVAIIIQAIADLLFVFPLFTAGHGGTDGQPVRRSAFHNSFAADAVSLAFLADGQTVEVHAVVNHSITIVIQQIAALRLDLLGAPTRSRRADGPKAIGLTFNDSRPTCSFGNTTLTRESAPQVDTFIH